MVAPVTYREAIRSARLVTRIGKLTGFRGAALEATGVDARIGELCSIKREGGHQDLLAEVVGFTNEKLILMPLGEVKGVRPGAEVLADQNFPCISCSDELKGRVVDPLGSPLDGGHLVKGEQISIWGEEINPFQRNRIDTICQTRIPAIDGFLTLGKGQRTGIFAGSGVGKSTLINNLVKGHDADINVIALIGERGREAMEFIQDVLGDEGLSNSVVIVASAELPALMRVYSAFSAAAIAEYFCKRNMNVLLAMDSVTRLAMAQREVGLATGEPPTTKGYTPSCFNLLPKLVERAGAFKNGGTITAYYTVLVEGDDLSDPVADHMRAVLDGHIVLDRDIASEGKYPAINLRESVSRIMPQLVDSHDRLVVKELLESHSLYQESKPMIQIGAYKNGENESLDAAIVAESELSNLLYKGKMSSRDITISELTRISALSNKNDTP
ncbi:FliI/YscN family ATPase [Microbulbifer rhizosphaerae]|uniref:protein-secreting ATPase n=1 Tax=Microbulbifer rhizosphaerae TaxID=1562603 RepID=A0A7W4ZCJ2_9GAMM|nr:FliI/YscN family ATPase [Microbulbifer rhizosphaerae]MBB3063494.1 FliI/YscN family ATPase [Microbulbifer rhizosphaerae]